MAAASAPSPSFPTKTSETISPTASQISPPPSPPFSQPPPVSLSSPPISQPNATPDIPAPPLASPPTLSPPPPLLSPPPPLPSPITLSPPPPVPNVPVTAPPPVPVTPSPPPPQITTTPSPPLPTSPSLSPPTLSPPPPSLSPPSPTVPNVPAPKASPFSSPPPPSRKRPLSPPSSSSSSPPPSSPSLSTSPPLPSPNPNTSIIPATPPINQFPLATPTSPNNSGSNSPDSNKSSNSGFNQGGNNNNNNKNNNSSSNGGGLSTGASISIAIVTIFLLASFIVAGIWYVKKKKRPVNGYNSVFIMPSPTTPAATSSKLESPLARYTQTPFGYNSSGSQNLVNSKYFSYEELHEITEGFSVNNVLGEGGFGIVYKGRLQDGRQVAVKRLTGGGGQGEREFQAEVEIISRVHHRHLVSLVGYCSENEQRVLVYDFVPNNTLHYHLHGKNRPVLEWGIRVKIAAGAARGIAYLHEDCQPRIIHRDIKSSNILLDEDFEALVADFGLARLALDACTHVTTRVMGTFGYLAPEYASSGKLTERSDVFSYGVVLLELVTGRKPVDSSLPLGDESLVEWARPLLTEAIETGKFEEIIDPKLGNNYNKVEMVRMIEAAAACVRHSASRRPKMSQVVRVFDSLADVDLTNGVQPGKSELFNVANSAEIRLFQRMAFGNDFDFSAEFSHTTASLNSNSNLNPNLDPNNYRRL